MTYDWLAPLLGSSVAAGLVLGGVVALVNSWLP